ncbi:glutathione S-transferase family protein [Okeania sp. SIO2C2]|uniref:glutathione S-transferase family protein n=1 Tax=Okeania sp. SIO2C2 TaxID=2607787 RepID=UPI00257FFF38|nr:glutathione S-transferase family protein [Okeania sp. SIO2C2]
MASMKIKMYDLVGAEDNRAFSPYCWRIRMALAHKQLEVQRIPWHFTEKEAIAFSGQEKVPVIVDGNQVVFDSWNIANYLEETYPNQPSLFGCSQAKSQVLFIKNWDEKVLIPALLPMLIYNVFEHIDAKDKTYFRETREQKLGKPLEEFKDVKQSQIDNFRTILSPLRETLNQQPFLAGEKPNFADYIIFARFQFARSISPIKFLETNDPVNMWREKMLDLFNSLARQSLGYN